MPGRARPGETAHPGQPRLGQQRPSRPGWTQLPARAERGRGSALPGGCAASRGHPTGPRRPDPKPRTHLSTCLPLRTPREAWPSFGAQAWREVARSTPTPPRGQKLSPPRPWPQPQAPHHPGRRGTSHRARGGGKGCREQPPLHGHCPPTGAKEQLQQTGSHPAGSCALPAAKPPPHPASGCRSGGAALSAHPGTGNGADGLRAHQSAINSHPSPGPALQQGRAVPPPAPDLSAGDTGAQPWGAGKTGPGLLRPGWHSDLELGGWVDMPPLPLGQIHRPSPPSPSTSSGSGCPAAPTPLPHGVPRGSGPTVPGGEKPSQVGPGKASPG